MNGEKSKSVAIVGAGITGLTAAYELAKRGLRVEVFEAHHQVGGELAVLDVGGTLVERYYHHLFRGDHYMIELMRELGIESSLEWNTPQMAFFSAGGLYPFTTPLDLLRFKPLPFMSRIQMGLATMRLRRIQDYHHLEDIPAAEYLPPMVGREAFEILWKPLLMAKFGDSWPEISMAWFWGRVHVRFKSRTNTGLRELLGYVRGSFRTITRALESRAKELGVVFHLKTPVSSIDVANNRATGLTANGQRRVFDFVLATVGLPLLRRFLGNVSLSRDLGAVEYRGALVMLMRLRRRVSPFYWTNIGEEAIPFAGLIEHTNFIAPEVYGGAHLLYVSNYVPASERLFNLSDSELFDEYAPHIERIFPDFRRSLVEEFWVSKDPVAQPVIKTGYQRRIPEFRSPIDRLYICNTSQIYPEDRGTNYNVRIARQAAELIGEEAGLPDSTST